jgi:UTP--glucose-1-phosphate uridylyltransferase
MILDEVDRGSREILEQNGLDAEAFERLRAALVEGSLTAESNVVRGEVEPPLESDLTVLPAPGQPGFDEAVATGTEALRKGRVAMVVLAGGMATRFGGGVKAVAESFRGRSFLEVKLGETLRLADALGAEIPVVLMTSFATDEAVREHVAARQLGDPLRFRQTAAPRLRPDGSLLVGEDGQASLYGPGHGDLIGCIRASGTLDELVRRGVQTVMVSNVDNLAARLDPAVVGMHVLAGTPLTVEVVAKGGDTGGAPARVDGRPQLLEAFRFPPGFDQSRIPVFNTNTSLIAVDALREPVDLTWLLVEKRVGGETAIQFERLYHELSAHVPTTFLVVPRTGPRGRFLPVKEPADLEEVLPLLQELLGASPADPGRVEAA